HPLLAPVTPGDREQVAVHRRAPGEHVAALQVPAAAVEVAHHPARLLDQESAGCDVPGGETELEEAVVDPGRGVGEVERGGAAAADRPGPEQRLAEDPEVEVERSVRAVGVAGGEKGAVEPGAARDREALPVE